MLGTIGFKALKVKCIIGVLPHERIEKQDLLIDLKVETDLSRVFQTEDLKDTIDYTLLADVCQNMASIVDYLVVEKYALDVIQELFKRFPVKSVWIRIKKPAAIPEAEYALIEINRIRFWEDPTYLLLTISTPDILERSLINAVLKGQAEYLKSPI